MASQAALTGAFFFPVALEGSGRGLASAPWPVWGGADIRPRRLNGAGATELDFRLIKYRFDPRGACGGLLEGTAELRAAKSLG